MPNLLSYLLSVPDTNTLVSITAFLARTKLYNLSSADTGVTLDINPGKSIKPITEQGTPTPIHTDTTRNFWIVPILQLEA